MARYPEQVRFGRRLSSLRRGRGLSHEGLAEKADLHRNYVGGIERGERNVGLRNVVKLARALGVTTSELVKGV